MGAALVYLDVTTTDGEAVMNEFMDAWNSGEVTALPDVYAPEAVLVAAADAFAVAHERDPPCRLTPGRSPLRTSIRGW